MSMMDASTVTTNYNTMSDRSGSPLGRLSDTGSSVMKRFQLIDLASDTGSFPSKDRSAALPPTSTTSVITRETSVPSEQEISAFFAKKALKKEHYIQRGKHPASIKRDSELFHYTKLSSNRRERIAKGHKFWNVIDAETIEATIPKSEIAPDQADDLRNHPNIKGTSLLKGGLSSFGLEKTSTELQRLEMKVDFRNKSKLYYGMSFVVINYSQEVLFVNTRDELRCKPLRLINSSDRIKFKLIDLLNPSNPKPVQFGDSMWLQVLDNEGDNSIQHGHLLASKLFRLPQHSLINFDVLNDKEKERDPEKDKHVATDDDSSSYLNSATNKRSQRKRKSLLKETEMRGKSFDDGTEIDSVRTSATPPDYQSDDDDSVPDRMRGKHALNEGITDSLDTATICGDLQVSRIIEVRKGDVVAIYEDKVLSDDQALRYIGKQALMTGRWMAHSAELKNRGKSVGNEGLHEDPDGDRQGLKSIHSAGTTTDANSNCVMSCSPIFIMQDLYCIATKHASEHKKWPPRSTMIINHSARIDKEQANIYRLAYQESAVVKTTLAQRMYQTGSTKLCDGDEEIDDAVFSEGIVSGGIAMAKKYRSSRTNSNTSLPQQPKGDQQHDYGCLRKVVRRGFPYDFSVDRKCVWQFCLFEQFSDTHLKLSVKDQAAKKVMENATMAMKFSQLNREGAKEHTHSHSQDPSMPPLKSGGMFSKSLREINMKVFKEMDATYFHERRIKEARLRDHFNRHISEVLIMEKIDDEQQRTGRVPSSAMSKSSSAYDFKSSGHDSYSFLPSARIPNLMHKPEVRRTAYLISTLPRNRKNSISDSLSLYSSTASTLRADIATVDSPKVSTSRLNASSPQHPNKTLSPTTDDSMQYSSEILPSLPGLEQLESVKKHFHIKTTSTSDMILDSQVNSNSFDVFNTLSEGEKLLAMHRTFHRVSESIVMVQRQQEEISNSLFRAATNQTSSTLMTNSQQSQRQHKQQQLSVQQQQREQRDKKSMAAKPSIASKLAKLRETDAYIDQVLLYKDRLEKAKKDEKLEGVELSLS